MRTLLADDEPLALERLEFFFRGIPEAEVVGMARDGREAAEAIVSLQPELVLLDLQMPERDGLSVAASLPAQHQPEVIFITALADYAPEAVDLDAADYLLKPVSPDRLRQAVQRARCRRDLRRLGFSPRSVERPSGIWIQAPAHRADRRWRPQA